MILERGVWPSVPDSSVGFSLSTRGGEAVLLCKDFSSAEGALNP
jgi:hypothetical protein